MSDLYLRIDAKRNVVLYRARSNQGVIMSAREFMSLHNCCDDIVSFIGKNNAIAVEIGEAGFERRPQEFHRRIRPHYKRGGGLIIDQGLHEPDLFDVRRERDCP